MTTKDNISNKPYWNPAPYDFNTVLQARKIIAEHFAKKKAEIDLENNIKSKLSIREAAETNNLAKCLTKDVLENPVRNNDMLKNYEKSREYLREQIDKQRAEEEKVWNSVEYINENYIKANEKDDYNIILQARNIINIRENNETDDILKTDDDPIEMNNDNKKTFEDETEVIKEKKMHDSAHTMRFLYEFMKYSMPKSSGHNAYKHAGLALAYQYRNICALSDVSDEEMKGVDHLLKKLKKL